jgi:hypothetical protein
LFIHAARTFLYRVVTAKNRADGSDDGCCRCWDKQGSESTVIQVELLRLRERFPAPRVTARRQKDFLFHADMAEQGSAEFRVSRWLNLSAARGSPKGLFDAYVILFQITRNCSCHALG